jgi:hypothetical protein
MTWPGLVQRLARRLHRTPAVETGATAMPEVTEMLCSCCGEPLPADNLRWNFEEPDPLTFLSDDERAAQIGTQTSQIVTVRGLGNFIRVILPVPVEHDREATFGVWLCITSEKEWTRVIAAASQGDDAWTGTTFAGRLTTAVQPWPETFGAWTQAVAPGPNKVARLVHSADPTLARVLTTRWPIDTIRAAVDEHVPAAMTGGPTPSPYAPAR